MLESGYPVLTLLIFFPLLSCVVLFFLKNPMTVRVFTLAAFVAELVLALPLLRFDCSTASFQFVQQVPWVSEWGLQYYVGLDGISILMVALVLLIFPLCVLCSWSSITERVKEFHFCLLFLASACVGVFAALDLVLFYLFWEVTLIPIYLMVALWGGEERRYASIKLVLYTLAGSVLMLVAIIAFRITGGTFSIPELMQQEFPFRFQAWTFLAMALAFAVKVPMVPLHTWLPPAYVHAPVAGSVILSAILAKMGAYGFFRLCLPIVPQASHFFTPLMIALSVASILYGGLLALGQSDIKKIIAYASVAHMGFVTLGIFLGNLYGFQGALFQMFNHGITTGALFILMGILYERSQTNDLAGNLALGKSLPVFMGFWGFMAFAAFAFPGTNNFVGELLVFLGAFQRKLWVGFFAIPGAMLAAAYMLRPTQQMAWGAARDATRTWKDLNKREWVCLLPLGALVLYVGLAPTLFFNVMNPTLKNVVTRFETQRSTVAVSTEMRDDLHRKDTIVREP